MYGGTPLSAEGPGELVTLPEPIGAKATLDVAEILASAQPKGRQES
ncbi:hypothetical protein ABZX93_20990 [Streptomyces sp. NPDC006632]